MKRHQSYRERSKENWGRTQEEGSSLTIEQINCGALLRIADATEAMAKRHTDLIDALEREKTRNQHYMDRAARLERRNAALRGVITRMKRQAGAGGPA